MTDTKALVERLRVSLHELKTVDLYWEAVKDGRKPFEVRRNDRAFQTGDILELVKTDERGIWVPNPGDFSRMPKKQIIRKQITYLLQGGQFGIEPGYCVLGLGEPVPAEQAAAPATTDEWKQAETAQAGSSNNDQQGEPKP